MAFVHIISGAEIATIIRYLVLVKSHKKCIGIYQCHFTQKTHLLIISAVWCMHTQVADKCVPAPPQSFSWKSENSLSANAVIVNRLLVPGVCTSARPLPYTYLVQFPFFHTVFFSQQMTNSISLSELTF